MLDYENEQWRDVGIAPGYQVSDHGRVRRLKVLRPMGGELRGVKRRPLYVRLFVEKGPAINVRIVDLVAAAFIGKPPVGHLADHKDGDRLNVQASNVHYVSAEDYRLAHKRRSGLVYLTKPKKPKAPKPRKPYVRRAMISAKPTPEEAAMIAALQARERRDAAAALADRIARATVAHERREERRLAEMKRQQRAADRLIREQIKEAKRQEIQARKEEAKRNTRPSMAPRPYLGSRNDFAAIWSQTPLTVGLRMEGEVAILTDRDGRTRRVEPGDCIAAYRGRIIRRSKNPA